MFLPFPMFVPWGKISQFTIISIVCEPHFGSDEQDFTRVNNHTAVVQNILMNCRPVITLTMARVVGRDKRTFRYRRQYLLPPQIRESWQGSAMSEEWYRLLRNDRGTHNPLAGHQQSCFMNIT